MHRQYKSSYVDVESGCGCHLGACKESPHALRDLLLFRVLRHQSWLFRFLSPFSLGTVLLRGGNSATLAKCHEILMYLIKVRMNQEREISFYINLGITSTPYSIMKEPNLYVKTQRLLASSPCVVFGKWK